MTPDHVQAIALQWIAVAVALTLAVISAYTSVQNAFIGALHKQQIDQNTVRLNGQSTKIDTLLLNTPPPGQGSATATVTGPNGATATATEGTPPNDSVPSAIVPVGIPNAAPLP